VTVTVSLQASEQHHDILVRRPVPLLLYVERSVRAPSTSGSFQEPILTIVSESKVRVEFWLSVYKLQ
jgi:hypothetical protein